VAKHLEGDTMNKRWSYQRPLAWAAGLLAVVQTSGAAAQQQGKAPAEAAATVTVLVPADALLFFNGTRTTKTGGERVFSTPPLPVGKNFHYIVVARWTKDGKTVEQKRTVRVTAGAKVRVDFLTARPDGTAKLSEEEALKLGTEAYVYGYPLVTMELTRRVMTNSAEPRAPHAPMGQFANMKTYPDASFKDVTAPNADTLYSAAWLDLAKEPYVLSLPDMGDRYYLMPMLSGWTDVFAVPGTRTTGTKAQKHLISGPGWKGELPEGVKQLKSPTNMVWIIGRTYCTGTKEDYKAVHALQAKYALVPLSAFGKDYTPPKGKVDPDIDMKMPVRDQVNKLDAAAFFKLLAALLKDNPPAKEDAEMVATLAKLGIVPGQDFDAAKLDPAVAKALQGVTKAAQEKIVAHLSKAGVDLNGWGFSTKTGLYGTDFLQRATITWFGLGANRPQDAVYPTSKADADGKPYSGANRYVLHFASKKELPPARAFWSLTMYNAEMFFVDNPLNRYNLGSRSALAANKDGSIDLYIQNESPGKDKESNWLPAPKGQFVLMLRLYWPEEEPPSILDGSWRPPAVRLVKE
jgi:uncharacterized protein (TIGR03000 family)